MIAGIKHQNSINC